MTFIVPDPDASGHYTASRPCGHPGCPFTTTSRTLWWHHHFTAHVEVSDEA